MLIALLSIDFCDRNKRSILYRHYIRRRRTVSYPYCIICMHINMYHNILMIYQYYSLGLKKRHHLGQLRRWSQRLHRQIEQVPDIAPRDNCILLSIAALSSRSLTACAIIEVWHYLSLKNGAFGLHLTCPSPNIPMEGAWCGESWNFEVDTCNFLSGSAVQC